MAARPLSPPSAPPRSSPKDRGDDVLSMVLSWGEEEGSSMASPEEPWRQQEAEILGVLRKSDKPLTVYQLCREVGLDFLTVSDLLLDLRQRDEIILRGSPGKEVVLLNRAQTR
jgi:hypothetical protein